MGYPIYHSAYTAAQIEASLGKTPRINATTRTWEIWDIATSAYVDTGVSIDTQLFVDPTLTQSGYAADAKAAGDELTDLNNQLSEISQTSRNLWPFASDVTFTKFQNFSSANVIFPAGTYAFSATVVSSGSGTFARIQFLNSSNEEITYKTIEITGTRKQAPTIQLTEDCYSIYLFSQNGSSASTGISATFSNIQMEKGVMTDYVPHTSARDTVLETIVENLPSEIKIKDTNMLPVNTTIDSLGFITTGDNLFNYDDSRNASGYLSSDGSIVSNASYKTSWYIAVDPDTTYYIGGYGGDYYYYRFLCEFDEDLNIVAYTDQPHTSFVTNSSTKYIRFTYNSSYDRGRVFLSKTAIETGYAPAYAPKIPSAYLDNPESGSYVSYTEAQTLTLAQKEIARQNIGAAESSGSEQLMSRYFALTGDLEAGDYLYNTAHANSIRNNDRMMFNADISSFSSIEIGFAWYSTSYKYNRFIIDDTNITVYDYAGNTTVKPHGITLSNNIQILIESDFMRTCDLTLISNGSSYKAENLPLDRRRVMFPYVQSVGSVLPNAKLTWSCSSFNKDVWIFGDSYIGSYTDKWVKYAYTYGYTENVLWDAFPGEDSEESFESLTNLFTIAKPKIIVWCLGMNDGGDSDSSTPSTSWLTVQTSLRSFCDTNGIELVLATIPTVPTINHEAKNANVRASGYRYIDFARAVGANSSGEWFGYGTDHDMLSDDGVHPSGYGAKALFGRVVLDLPEIMITP